MTDFIGRKRELTRLKGLLTQKRPKLIVLKGRRRIGKTRLLTQFGKSVGKVFVLSGLAPDRGITAKEQREEFARQLDVEFGVKGIKTDDWGNLFWHLSQQVQKGRVLVVLDEISWMAMDEPTFLPKLKIAWETYFKKNPEIILALCSSISLWIEDNLLSSTGFMGRQSLILTLKELSLDECGGFWHHIGSRVSAQEKLLTLAVTGGIPRYLEEIDPNLPSEENIKKLCFTQEGILFQEFDQIFSDLFGGKKHLYKDICEALAQGSLDAQTLYQKIGLKGTGGDYKHLKHLALSGFITKDYSWHLNNGKLAKIAWYRLSDNYCRFYLKYILPNKQKIEQDDFDDISLASLPNWSSIIGLQFENIVLNNRKFIKKTLHLTQQEIIYDNPYSQRGTGTKKGCQVDYLIQTRFNTIYICEIKYSKDPIAKSVIDEVNQKIEALKIKNNFSVRPVLIHCNNVSESILESGFFAHIINFAEFVC